LNGDEGVQRSCGEKKKQHCMLEVLHIALELQLL
jgi:hypothetical protein